VVAITTTLKKSQNYSLQRGWACGRFQIEHQLSRAAEPSRFARPVAKTDCNWRQLQHTEVGQTSAAKQSLQQRSYAIEHFGELEYELKKVR